MMMKSFEPRPIFQNYVALLSQRPAYKRFTEQGDQLVARVKTQATVA
jgi:hypothetical protein